MIHADAFVLNALHFWKACRHAGFPTLPALHQRLVSVGALMIALPLDDFFSLCVMRGMRKVGSSEDEATPDGMLVLSLLHAADKRWMWRKGSPSEWNSESLLMLSAWAVRRQFADDLGLSFCSAGRNAGSS